MVVTWIVIAAIAVYLTLFLTFEIRRRKQGRKSFFTEEYCDCKVMTSKRLLAYYRKRKRREQKRGKA